MMENWLKHLRKAISMKWTFIYAISQTSKRSMLSMKSSATSNSYRSKRKKPRLSQAKLPNKTKKSRLSPSTPHNKTKVQSRQRLN